jgi:hypothetical protein
MLAVFSYCLISANIWVISGDDYCSSLSFSRFFEPTDKLNFPCRISDVGHIDCFNIVVNKSGKMDHSKPEEDAVVMV